MWLHRQNEYEWKYIGIWLDKAPENLKNKIKTQFPDISEETIFITFKDYSSNMEMIIDNLSIRNKIYAIQNDPKLEKEDKKSKLAEIESARVNAIAYLSTNPSSLILYINSTDEFKRISLKI